MQLQTLHNRANEDLVYALKNPKFVEYFELSETRDGNVFENDVLQFTNEQREIKMVQSKVGEAIVRKVFDIKGVGVIAGCYVQDGRFVRDGSVIIWRGRKKIGEGKINSLQRANKNVKEVHTGYECAFGVKDLTDYIIDDRVECFIEVPESEKK